MTLLFPSFLSSILKIWCLFQDYLTKILILPWGGTQKGNQESVEFYKGIRKIYPLKSGFGGKKQKSNVFLSCIVVSSKYYIFCLQLIKCILKIKTFLMLLNPTPLAWNISENVGVVGNHIKLMKFSSFSVM